MEAAPPRLPVLRKYQIGDLPLTPSGCSIKLACQAADAGLRIPAVQLAAEQRKLRHTVQNAARVGGEISPFGKASPKGPA